jgi:hypothetical protein
MSFREVEPETIKPRAVQTLHMVAAVREQNLMEGLRQYESEGFTGQMAVAAGARVQCYSCQRLVDPREVRMIHNFRTEGSSDPGDEATIAAVECPACFARGTLVIPYGPTASADDAAVFRRLIDGRGVVSPA